MQTQRIVIIALACLLPIWGLALAKQFSPEDDIQISTTKPQKQVKAQYTDPVLLNPPVKDEQPNLSQGYLFNRDRFIKTIGANGSNNENINIETLQYDGSIIIGETRKALVSFATDKPKTGQKVNRKPTNRVKTTRSKRKSKIIAVDDKIAGYTVTAVEPLQLTFSRGGKEIHRDLFAQEKQRKTTPQVKRKKANPSRSRATVPKRTKNNTTRQNSRHQPPPPPIVH